MSTPPTHVQNRRRLQLHGVPGRAPPLQIQRTESNSSPLFFIFQCCFASLKSIGHDRKAARAPPRRNDRAGTRTPGQSIGMEGKEGATRVWDCGSPLYDSSELASLSHIIDRHTMALPGSENSANQKKMTQMVVWGDVAETEKKKTKTTNAVSKIRKGLLEVFECISFRRRSSN